MREYLRTAVALLAVAVGLSMAGCGNTDDASGHAKHVIVVTLDTTRADHLGCYGNDIIKTPNLDAFARDAVLFEQAYTTANVTLPAHISLFTSLYMKDHGVPDNKYTVPDFKEYMPALFRTAGYRTAAFTSSGLLTPEWGVNKGFDDFYYSSDFKSAGSVTTGKALRWLENNADKDFFLWVHYYDPHFTYNPPAPYRSMYNFRSDQRLSELKIASWDMIEKSKKAQEYIKQSDDPEYYRNLYKGEVSYMDSEFGRLVDRLKKLGIYDRCTIVVVADHGESLGEHDMYFLHRGLHDVNVKIPLMFKLGGDRYAGRRVQNASILDVFPTLFNLLGIQYAGPIRGKDLTGIIQDQAAPEVRDTVYYQGSGGGLLGIKRGDYTYIAHELKKDTAGLGLREVEASSKRPRNKLFNHKDDPLMNKEISAEASDIVYNFDREVNSFYNDVHSMGPAKEITNEKQLETLKSLGYVQ